MPPQPGPRPTPLPPAETTPEDKGPFMLLPQQLARLGWQQLQRSLLAGSGVSAAPRAKTWLALTPRMKPLGH